MEHSTPPSPAPSKSESMAQDLHALLQHNISGGGAYPQDSALMGHIQHAHSQPTSRYGTPAPQPFQSQGYETAFPYQQRGGGGPMGYHQPMYSHESSPYGPIPEASHPYSTPATSPPTPSRGFDVLSTRSGSTIQKRALGPKSTRIEKSTPPKKKKDRTKVAKNLPALEKPMSECTKDSQIPVADIEAYVNRSVEVRRAEIESGKNPGRVKRPMNAFMLYRKAYQQRAKEIASQHNHQVVSRICGMSWPLEPLPVREQFKRWADLERDNHQRAHPDYKFTPAKPQKQKYNQRKLDDSEDSDLEGYQWDAPRDSCGQSGTKTPNYDPDGDYIQPRSAYGHSYQYRGQQATPQPNRSAYEHANPGKPMPAPYDHRDLSSMYYETQIHNQRHAHGNLTEDVIMRKTPSPAFAYQQNANLSQYSPSQYHNHTPPPVGDALCLPQASRFDDSQLLHMPHQPLCHPLQQHQQQSRRFEQPIDPTLPMYDTSNLAAFYDSPGSGGQQSWQHSQHTAGDEAEGSQFSDAFNMGMQATGLQETLAVEPSLSVEQRAQYLHHASDWHIEDVGDDAHGGWGDLGSKTEV